jgi:hypothetical protein
VTADGAREHGPLFAGYFHVQAVAGVGVANAHVVFVQPMPQEPGHYTVTFFAPPDVARLATMLETSAAEAAAQTTLLNLTPGNMPNPVEILHNAPRVPWPPSD